MNASLFHMSNIMSDVKLHGTESLLERIFVLQEQLEAMNRKYDSLQLLHTTVVKQNYELETKVYFLQNENECIGERMNEREQFYNSRCRQLESQYDKDESLKNIIDYITKELKKLINESAKIIQILHNVNSEQ